MPSETYAYRLTEPRTLTNEWTGKSLCLWCWEPFEKDDFIVSTKRNPSSPRRYFHVRCFNTLKYRESISFSIDFEKQSDRIASFLKSRPRARDGIE